MRLRFRLDQRIAHAVLERVARAASRGRVFDVGMRLHHRAAGAQEPIGFAQIVLQLASGRGVSSELENPRSKGLSASGMRLTDWLVVSPGLKSDRDRRCLLTALQGEEVAPNLCRQRRVCPLSLARRRKWRSVREASCASGGVLNRLYPISCESHRGRQRACETKFVAVGVNQVEETLSPFGVAGRSSWLAPRRERTFV